MSARKLAWQSDCRIKKKLNAFKENYFAGILLQDETLCKIQNT